MRLADSIVMVIVVMGVAGSGKTLVASALAQRFGWRFIEGDLFHPRPNIEKMSNGVPLTDEDRDPWLRALHGSLEIAEREEQNVVLACSALRKRYREELAAGLREVRFVYLRVDRALAESRLAARTGHFMPAALAGSQFDALEEPEDAIVVDAGKPVEALVDEISSALKTE